MPDPAGAAGLTSIERSVIDAVDDSWLLATLADLVKERSVAGAEDSAQRMVGGLMRDMGLDVDLWPIDIEALREHPAYSAEVERTAALGLAGSFGGEGRSLMLNGHVDVVPVGDESRWAHDPWMATRLDGNVYGRGTCDMKGGLAAALTAVRAVHRTGIELDGSVTVASVVGEEDGGLGTLATLDRGHRADAAVIVEPTCLAVAPVQAGAFGFRLTVTGAAAHGAMRTEGVSALMAAIPLFAALEDLERRRNDAFFDPLFAAYDTPLSLSIGTVRAGDWSSTVPETLIAEGRYGVAPGEDAADARRAFEAAIDEAAAAHPWLESHPPHVEWIGGQFHPATTDPGSAIVGAVRESHATITRQPAATTAVPYGSDLRHLVNTGGIPTVLYGPGDVRAAHRTDEYIPEAELTAAARSLALLIVRWCGTR